MFNFQLLSGSAAVRLLILLSTFCTLAPCVAAHAGDGNLLWGDLVISTGKDSLLPGSPETEEILTRLFAQDRRSDISGSARAALMTLNQLVVLSAVTLADGRSSELHVPLTTGEQVDVYLEDIVLGGTVIAFSPLTRSVLTSLPILGVRRLRLSAAPTTGQIQAEALEAGRSLRRLPVSVGSRSEAG